MKSFIHRIIKFLGLKYTFYKLNFLVKRYFPGNKPQETRLTNFYSQFIKKGDLVFDVGANLGSRTISFLSLGARVVCVEPNEELCKILKLRFGKKITIINAGLGEKDGELNFTIGSNHLVSTFSDKFSHYKETERNTIQYNKTVLVKVKTLDGLVKEYGKPDFCKIDVEGYEKQVLSGLTQQLGIISIEFTCPSFNQETIDCLNKMGSINYDSFNYSFSETLKFELEKWVSKDELIAIINSGGPFAKQSYGDIYARRAV